MKFTMIHNNLNVFNLDRSLKFYGDALGLTVASKKESADGGFILAFLTDGSSQHQLELTWLRDRKTPYELGDNEVHLAFSVDDYASAYQKHKEMGCICFENTAMGIYFIEDPDGYWIEIVPKRG